MDIKIKLKLKYSHIVKVIYGLFVIIFIIAVYILTNFLNTNLYQVITQTEDIVVLKKEVASREIVDAALFENVLNELEEKQKEPSFNIKDVKDFFTSPTNRNEKQPENSMPPPTRLR